MDGNRSAERRAEIEAAVAEVREIERREGITRASLERVREPLLRLAARTDLFNQKEFPPPGMYRVAEDADHRFALYVNSSGGRYGTPAHNHATWAVIVGVSGEELNRLYDREGDGVREKGRHVVRQGTGVCFMPDDLHSIHIETPLMNLHLYGLGLDHLHDHEFYNAEKSRWMVFPAKGDIREAR